MSCHARSNCPSIILSYPISSCAISDPLVYLETSHNPGITPALSLSQMSRGSVKGMDAFSDTQVSWQISERPHRKHSPSPYMGNATDDVYFPAIIVS